MISLSYKEQIHTLLEKNYGWMALDDMDEPELYRQNQTPSFRLLPHLTINITLYTYVS
jgi:hypothetical protein